MRNCDGCNFRSSPGIRQTRKSEIYDPFRPLPTPELAEILNNPHGRDVVFVSYRDVKGCASKFDKHRQAFFNEYLVAEIGTDFVLSAQL